MKTFVRLMTAFALVFFLFHNAKLKDLGDNLLIFSLKAITYCVSLSFLAYVLAGIRWHVLLPTFGTFRLMAVNFVGQFYATVLPGQMAGEFAKAYHLGKGRSDAEHIAASVIVDKLVSLLGLLIVAVIGLVASNTRLPSELLFSFLLLILLLLGGLFALKIPYVNKIIHLFLKKWVVLLPRFESVIFRVTLLLDAWGGYLTQPFRLIHAFVLAVFFQLICVFFVILLAQDLSIDISFANWCWIFGLVSIAVLLPISIGGIGVREGTFAGALSLFGVPLEKSIALSLAVFAISLVGAFIGGFLEIFCATTSPGSIDEETGHNLLQPAAGLVSSTRIKMLSRWCVLSETEKSTAHKLSLTSLLVPKSQINSSYIPYFQVLGWILFIVLSIFLFLTVINTQNPLILSDLLHFIGRFRPNFDG
jgi:glycosyltransferase 2 family protein